MSKKNRIVNILIVVFIILVIGLSSLIILKMNNFDFKKFEFSNPKTVEKDHAKEEDDVLNKDDTLPNEDDMLPSEDDVLGSLENETSNGEMLPSESDLVPSGGGTTTPNNGTSTTKKTTTTTKKITTNPSTNQNNGIPSVSTVKFDSEINSVKLNPIKTRHTELDNKVGNILNSITNSSMTNNQKLYAVFRYIIDHSEYGNPFVFGNELIDLINTNHYNELDGSIVYNARKILNSGVGVCDDYAALFVVMARRLGFDAYWVGGSVKKATGGTTPHAWANILVNGTYYVFDPQIADKRPEQEKYYYGKTDKGITIYTYNNRESYVSRFKLFKEATPLKLQVNLSGAVNDSKTVTSYYSNSTKNIEYEAYEKETLSFNIKMSGASKYKYSIRVIPSSGNSTDLYSSDYDTNNNINFNYKFDSTGGYNFYVSTWSRDTGIIAEYYFYVYVKSDNRIKDLDVTYTKDVNNLGEEDTHYVTFNSTVTKYNSQSTCTPSYEYSFISTDDPNGITSFYLKDGKTSMDYIPGYTYNVKVTAKCGSEKLEKTIIVN